jgi:hypothetical protein
METRTCKRFMVGRLRHARAGCRPASRSSRCSPSYSFTLLTWSKDGDAGGPYKSLQRVALPIVLQRWNGLIQIQL